MPEAIIETAIGLFFVFLLMSMVSSQIIEWIAGYRRWRAKNLEQTIRAMLSDPSVKARLNADALVLVDKLYAHPLIASLAPPGSKPSYIPADKFALALFDVIITAGSDSSTIGRARLGLQQVQNNLLSALPSAATQELLTLLSQIQAQYEEAFTSGLDENAIAALPLPSWLNNNLNAFLESNGISQQGFNALIQSYLSQTTDGDFQLDQIRRAVAKLAKARPQLTQLITSLFSSLDTYLKHGEPQLTAARRNVEEWFDDAMDRAGGWYKRSAQLWLGVVGLILALILNVDAINITETLWRDPTLRQNVVQQAAKYQLSETDAGQKITSPQEAAQATGELNRQLGQDLRLPIGWGLQLYKIQDGAACTVFQNALAVLSSVSPSAGVCLRVVDAAPNNSGLTGKLLGFLIIAVAISQGAPFWFDLLSQLLNLRGTGSVPASSNDKPSS